MTSLRFISMRSRIFVVTLKISFRTQRRWGTLPVSYSNRFYYTWVTYLQRIGVNSRVARELMRHSDQKLTDKIYTDSNLLPLGEVVRNLPDEENLIEVLTEIFGKM